MLGPKQYSIYRMAIKHAQDDSEQLPSLPQITHKIRIAIADPRSTPSSLAQLINKDPGLSALLVKSASSAMYRRANAPKTLADVVALLGYSNINNIAMIHSLRSLFVLRTPGVKQLFSHSWQRLVIKTSVATFLAQRLGYRPVEEAQMATLLTEVGSLAVLSTIIETGEIPDADCYFQLCRQYSRSLGIILLQKWGVDPEFTAVLKQSGRWEETSGGQLNLIDIVNLSIYYAVLLTQRHTNLPPLESLAAFNKLSERDRRCTKPNWLALIANNRGKIQEIVDSFR